jgi:S-adenosylmethionine synthetase
MGHIRLPNGAASGTSFRIVVGDTYGGAAPHVSGNMIMAGHFSRDDQSTPRSDASGRRAPWITPRVIVSDLADARANTIIPGGDGCDPVAVSYCYGS